MFERILVVVDGRRVSQAAVVEGAALARVHGAELILLCVMPRYAVPVADVPEFMTVTPQEFSQAAQANAAQWLADASACAGRAGVRCRTVTGSDDDPVPSIVQAARQHRCDLVVVASEGRNALVRLVSEGVVPGLVTASPVPVLVCKAGRRRRGGARAADPGDDAGVDDEHPQPCGRVMIVLEDDASARVAVSEGLALARVHDAGVVFLHLVREHIGPVLDAGAIAALSDPLLVRAAHDRAERCVSQAMEAAAAAGVAAEVHSRTASCGAQGVADATVEHDCDVIVIASDGHNAVVRLISGSLIPGLITVSPVPLLVCREAPATATDAPSTTAADPDADRTP